MFRKRARVWQYGNEEILLPLSRELSDYAVAVHNIFTVIEKLKNVHNFKFSQIFSTVAMMSYASEMLPMIQQLEPLDLMTSVDLFSSRDMLLFSRMFRMVNKRRYASKATKRHSIMDTVRFGQTEYGSFILALLSPVAPVLKQQGVLIDQEEELPTKKVVPIKHRSCRSQ